MRHTIHLIVIVVRISYLLLLVVIAVHYKHMQRI